jgi:molecular chaperone HscA
MLTDDVRAAGEGAMVTLEAAMKGDDHLAIRQAVEALDIATKPFAQARMNRAVEAGFKGKTLEEVEAAASHGDADKHNAHATGGAR